MKALIVLVNCVEYVEDPNITYDFGEPKGQCAKCGYKWYEHNVDAISNDGDRNSAEEIQQRNGVDHSETISVL